MVSGGLGSMRLTVGLNDFGGLSNLNDSMIQECVPKLIREKYPVPPMAPGQRECCGQEPLPAQTFPFSLLGQIQVLSHPLGCLCALMSFHHWASFGMRENSPKAESGKVPVFMLYQ